MLQLQVYKGYSKVGYSPPFTHYELLLTHRSEQGCNINQV